MKIYSIVLCLLVLPLISVSQDTVLIKQQGTTYRNDVIICQNNVCDTVGVLHGYINVADYFFKDSTCTILTERGWGYHIRIFNYTKKGWVNTAFESLVDKEMAKGFEYPNTYLQTKIEFVKIIDVGTAFVKIGDTEKSFFYELTEDSPELHEFTKISFNDFNVEQKETFNRLILERKTSTPSPKH